MLGCTGETRFLLGCISQLQDGSYFLEDMTGSLQLDLSDCQTSTGLYTGVLSFLTLTCLVLMLSCTDLPSVELTCTELATQEG